MSNLEATAIAFDELAQKRRALRLPQVDFEQYMQARHEDRAAVKSPIEFIDEVVAYFENGGVSQGYTLPWTKTHDLIRIRKAEVSCWHGYNGHGKSQLLGQVIMSLSEQGAKSCIASFEMHPYKTLARMTRQALGANKPTPGFIGKFFDWANGKTWLYDQQGTIDGDRVIAVLYYAVDTFGIDQFVIDSLMKCGMSSDTSHATYTNQMRFIDKLCAAAKDTGCHIHIVAHDKKPENESHHPHKYMIAGSSDISNLVDNCFGVWRNKDKEHDGTEGADCVLICDKQRNGEWEGNINLWYDKASYRYKGADAERVFGMRL